MVDIEFLPYKPNVIAVEFDYKGATIGFGDIRHDRGDYVLVQPDKYAKTTVNERFASRSAAMDRAAELAREWLHEHGEALT